MFFNFFEENNYFAGRDSETDFISVVALFISLLSIYFTYRAIIISKKTEIHHKKFEDLCLDPVRSELDRILRHLIENKTKLISTQLEFISKSSREFAMLLIRIRKIYSEIDVSNLQDVFNEFSDDCLNKSDISITESILDDFQILRITILNEVYRKALINLNDNFFNFNRIMKKIIGSY